MIRKYKNVPTVVDNVRFDSKREAHHYGILKALERTGKIGGLRLQPRFPMPPESWGRIVGVKSERDPGCICTYVADFSYQDENGDYHVVDVKGIATPVFKLKAKLFAFFYPAYKLEVVK